MGFFEGVEVPTGFEFAARPKLAFPFSFPLIPVGIFSLSVKQVHSLRAPPEISRQITEAVVIFVVNRSKNVGSGIVNQRASNEPVDIAKLVPNANGSVPVASYKTLCNPVWRSYSSV